jgi:hypothetical protein
MLLKNYILLKCIFVFASILSIASAGTPILIPTTPPAAIQTTMTTPATAPAAPPTIAPITITAPTPILAPPVITYSGAKAPTSIALTQPITTISPITPSIVPIPPINSVPATAQASTPPLTTFLPATPATIDFQPKTTTIQPLAAIYQLAALQQQQIAAAAAATAAATRAAENPATTELLRVNEELSVKYKKDYDYAVKEKIELVKEKENVLIKLQAQLKLQLEAQQFAAQQRARAIKEMQDKLVQEELKSKKEAEAMKLQVQSIVDLSPLILNVNQTPIKKPNSSSTYDFKDLQKVQKGPASCKHGTDKSECHKRSSHCTWGRVGKRKKHTCLFMCEKLSKHHCKRVSGCYFKDHKCKNK